MNGLAAACRQLLHLKDFSSFLCFGLLGGDVSLGAEIWVLGTGIWTLGMGFGPYSWDASIKAGISA